METKNLLKRLLLLISITLAILITIFAVKNKGKFLKSAGQSLTKTGIDISITKLHLIEEEEGKKQWELNAEKAEVINSKGITRMKNIQMSIFQKSEDNFSISADTGIIQNDTKDIELDGNIKVSNKQGYLLKTNNLKWASKLKVIQTNDEIKINGKDLAITGKGMKVNIDTEIMEIFGGVKVVYFGINKQTLGFSDT